MKCSSCENEIGQPFVGEMACPVCGDLNTVEFDLFSTNVDEYKPIVLVEQVVLIATVLLGGVLAVKYHAGGLSFVPFVIGWSAVNLYTGIKYGVYKNQVGVFFKQQGLFAFYSMLAIYAAFIGFGIYQLFDLY
ncbi:Uncharacterised protein [BD1-7 clade bacterium]|uniref:Uncharacterized protein n=1 Tax=BD1-7 clade bacterium TaxID=2029982 RepID=A0A5S9QIU0_9GAMM|nr:Uncharacterised protein [BD1-7 clade bacterium]